MLHIELIPLLTDNYAYLLRDSETNMVGVVDPSEGKLVMERLASQSLSLDYILCTHHHWDHTGGNIYLKEHTSCQIVGYEGDADRIPGIDITLSDASHFMFGNQRADIFFIPGHTTGHIAFYFAESKAVFVGDTLFAMGCGRLFEGTAEQMYDSLQLLANFPEDTRIYCGHEYTEANAQFALSIEADNADIIARNEEVIGLRKQGKPTIPTTVALEKATNPFMRAGSAEIFAKLRVAKDTF